MTRYYYIICSGRHLDILRGSDENHHSARVRYILVQDGVYVENVTAEKVDSEAAVLALLVKGSQARTIGETQARSCKARQFCILQPLCAWFKLPPEYSCAVLALFYFTRTQRDYRPTCSAAMTVGRLMVFLTLAAAIGGSP